MNTMRAVGLAVAAALLFVGVGRSAEAVEVTFESLVTEMTDMNILADVSRPEYTCKQFSSYDRKSRDPNVLTDENWFANGDAGQHIRAENRDGHYEWVMADMDGPGAIVRIWSANANDAGIIRIYLDGAEEPTIEMPLQDMLNGENAPFVSPIAGVRSKGWNSHYPIPYAKHCKITASEQRFYYQINYRTYPEETEVETYTADMAEKHADLIRKTADRLANCSLPMPVAAPRTVEKEESIAPGKAIDVGIEAESAAVYRVTCKVNADDIEAALRGCLLEVTFDEQAHPSVQAPLGDFFGTAPGPNAYQSICSGVLDDGLMYSNWVMPFRKSARLSITNHSGAPVAVALSLVWSDREWTADSMYFHAKWRVDGPIHTRPRQDWTYLSCQGKGRFVGDMLHVTNPVMDWWGEGDEKIYVDGETFPSHFGTGTEDYYGYAWCFNVPFTHAYHNQPRCDGPGNYGQTCVSRFHIMDNIPFTKSFKFDMEVWHWAECDITMAATSYWYATPGSTDAFAPVDPARLKVTEAPPLPKPKRVEGALEGEELKILSKTDGDTQTQQNIVSGWSAGGQLWWTDAKPGDALELAFNVDEAGRYEVLGVFTKAIDYGIMQLSVNGEKAGEPMDFFNDGVISTPETSIGVFDLTDGQNTLRVEVTGTNPKSEPKRHMFGLDYLLIKPAG